MNKLKTLVVSLVLIASSGIAHAVSVSGNMAITSDYIWRGICLLYTSPSPRDNR